MKIKLLILFFALTISVFSAEKGGTYTVPEERYTYEQICELTENYKRHGYSWQRTHLDDYRSEQCVKIGKYFYIKRKTSTYVIDSQGMVVSHHHPYKPRIENHWTLFRTFMENCSTVAWSDSEHSRNELPLLEKISEDEYIITVNEYVINPEGWQKIPVRVIRAYIHKGAVLCSLRQKCVGLGLRFYNNPKFSAEQFREEQIQVLRNLYKMYVTGEIAMSALSEEALQAEDAMLRLRDKEADWTVDKQWLEWHNTRMSGNGSFMHEFWEYRGNWGKQIAGILKLPKCDGAGVFPNVNAGVWTKDVAEKIHAVTGEKWHEVKSDGGMHSYTVWLHHEKSSTNLRFMIFHHYEAKDARDWVLSMCAYEPDLEDRKFGMVGTPFNSKLSQRETVEDLVSMLKVNPGWVGDMDFCFHPIIDDWGAEVENSEKRAVYFVRGNTGVALFSDNAEYDVLPIARAIDAELIKGIKQKKKKESTRESDK